MRVFPSPSPKAKREYRGFKEVFKGYGMGQVQSENTFKLVIDLGNAMNMKIKKFYSLRDCASPSSKSTSILISFLFILCVNLSAQMTPTPIKTRLSDNNYVNNEIIIKLKDGITENHKRHILTKTGNARPMNTRPNVFVIKIKDSLSVEDAVNQIKKDKWVEWAQPNYTWHLGIVGPNLQQQTPTNK